MIKSARELKNLKVQYEKELENFVGSKGEKRKLEGKLKGVIKQIKDMDAEDNTK